MNIRGRREDFMEEETFHLGLEESARLRQAEGEDSVRDTIHKAQTAVDVAVLSRVVTPLTCVSFFEWSRVVLWSGAIFISRSITSPLSPDSSSVTVTKL